MVPSHECILKSVILDDSLNISIHFINCSNGNTERILYAFLASTYTKEGVIIPPPPTATSLKTVATVAAMSPDEDLSASSASEVGLPI